MNSQNRADAFEQADFRGAEFAELIAIDAGVIDCQEPAFEARPLQHRNAGQFANRRVVPRWRRGVGPIQHERAPRGGAKPLHHVAQRPRFDRVLAKVKLGGTMVPKQRRVDAAGVAAGHGDDALRRHRLGKPGNGASPQIVRPLRNIQAAGQPVQQAKLHARIAGVTNRFGDLVFEMRQLAPLAYVLHCRFSQLEGDARVPRLVSLRPFKRATRINAERSRGQGDLRFVSDARRENEPHGCQQRALIEMLQRHGDHRERRFLIDNRRLAAESDLMNYREPRIEVADQAVRRGVVQISAFAVDEQERLIKRGLQRSQHRSRYSRLRTRAQRRGRREVGAIEMQIEFRQRQVQWRTSRMGKPVRMDARGQKTYLWRIDVGIPNIRWSLAVAFAVGRSKKICTAIFWRGSARRNGYNGFPTDLSRRESRKTPVAGRRRSDVALDGARSSVMDVFLALLALPVTTARPFEDRLLLVAQLVEADFVHAGQNVVDAGILAVFALPPLAIENVLLLLVKLFHQHRSAVVVNPIGTEPLLVVRLPLVDVETHIVLPLTSGAVPAVKKQHRENCQREPLRNNLRDEVLMLEGDRQDRRHCGGAVSDVSRRGRGRRSPHQRPKNAAKHLCPVARLDWQQIDQQQPGVYPDSELRHQQPLPAAARQQAAVTMIAKSVSGPAMAVTR